MRIPVWPGVRLSVWEKQNPDAVQVRMPYGLPHLPIRRVLSKRGWMLLLVRYDWRDKSYQPSEVDGLRSAVARVRNLHRPAECVNVRCKVGQWCIGCDPEGLDDCTEHPYPCPTIRALDGEDAR